MTDIKLPPKPEPLLEGVDYELWGQNVKADVWDWPQVEAYVRACLATSPAPSASASQGEAE